MIVCRFFRYDWQDRLTNIWVTQRVVRFVLMVFALRATTGSSRRRSDVRFVRVLEVGRRTDLAGVPTQRALKVTGIDSKQVRRDESFRE